MLLVSEKPSEFVFELAVYLQNYFSTPERQLWGYPTKVVYTEVEINRCLRDSGWKLVKEKENDPRTTNGF